MAKKEKKPNKQEQQIQHNKKALLEALEKSLGVVTTACKSVGLDRATFYRYYHADEAFRQAVDDIENVALDFSESNLHKRIAAGDTTAIIFHLKTKGKKRGYVERIEQTGKDGGPVETMLITPKADDADTDS